MTSSGQLRIIKVLLGVLTIPGEEMYGEVLQLILKTFNSKHGAFGYLDKEGNWVCPSLTRNVWQECNIEDKDVIFHYKVWSRLPIWARALAGKEAFYRNDEVEVPEKHLPIRNFMVAPIVYRDESIGALAVANRAGDYEDCDLDLLHSIAGQIAPLLFQRRRIGELEREVETLIHRRT